MPSVDDFDLDFEAPLTDSGGAPWPAPDGATITFLFQPPDGGVVRELTGNVDTARTLAYVTLAEDFLDLSGMWKWDVRITWATGQRTAGGQFFDVDPHLSSPGVCRAAYKKIGARKATAPPDPLRGVANYGSSTTPETAP